MSRLNGLALAAMIVANVGFIASASAQQPPHHLRGTVTDLQNGQLSLETASGKTQTVKLDDKTGLFAVAPADFSAIEPNKFVGITSVEQNGKRVAREVHVFAEPLRGLGEGHYPWDLETGPNMMTNANIGKVEEVGTDRVLKLDYKGGEQTIAVPPTATVVAFDKTTADQLKAGSKVFVIAKSQDDGGELAVAVVVGANGIKPPM
jgi:hypothetical protein